MKKIPGGPGTDHPLTLLSVTERTITVPCQTFLDNHSRWPIRGYHRREGSPLDRREIAQLLLEIRE